MLRRREFLGAGAALLLGKPALSATTKSCILLSLVGGPSQLDTWDLKPDAPSSVRGPFRPIRTNVSGIQISDIFPGMARHADKFALIRSCYHEGAALHEAGQHLMQTGRAFDADAHQPHIGAVAALTTGRKHVVLPHTIASTGANLPLAQAGGQLGDEHDPLLMSACQFDLHRESEKTRQRYGLNLFGQSCLMARRLVESGTPFVTVNMFESVFDEVTWDSHGVKPFSSIADYANHVGPMFDRAYAALIEDLHDRGLLANTLVAGIAEFGRSPKINPSGGRDHWPQCFTVHLAGAGIRGGQVYGSSDATGSEPKDNPVSPGALAATMYKALDLPSSISGIQLLDSHAKPIDALFV